ELHRTGPGGHFMDSKQTLKRFRDFWFPGLLDRKRREQWLAAGGQPLGQRLNGRVQEILKEHRARPLSQDQARGIQEVL
ncbi:trimethylamine methyltransferase, partial [Citrobacter sp. AAK_AS5]